MTQLPDHHPDDDREPDHEDIDCSGEVIQEEEEMDIDPDDVDTSEPPS